MNMLNRLISSTKPIYMKAEITGESGDRNNTLSTPTRATVVTGTTPKTQSNYLFPQ